MIEESELAKTFRQDEQKKVEAPGPGVLPSLESSEDPADFPSVEQKDIASILQSARSSKSQLENFLTEAKATTAAGTSASPLDPVMVESAQTVLKNLANMIQQIEDPSQLEELLGLNDSVTSLLARATRQRPNLGGLGIRLENGRPVNLNNGNALSADHPGVPDEEEATTPRLDKGKGRAEPEPEPVEPVLSPTRLTVESDEDEVEIGDSLLGQVESIVSPTDR
jgi:protein phosphatase 1 regulatory subunit 37